MRAYSLTRAVVVRYREKYGVEMFEQWIVRANRVLYERYGITIDDAGCTPDEFVSRWKDQGDTPEKAIEAFAEKYDLRRVERW